MYYIFLFDSTGRDGLSHAHEAGLVRVPVQLVAVLDNRTGVSPIIKVYLLTYFYMHRVTQHRIFKSQELFSFYPTN